MTSRSIVLLVIGLVAGCVLAVTALTIARSKPVPEAPVSDTHLAEALSLSAGLILNRAELTLRTVDLQSLLVKEATSGACSQGARFLLRQSIAENAVIRYAALVDGQQLSCQPGDEDPQILEEVLAPANTDLLITANSGRPGELAFVRRDDEGHGSAFWLAASELVADPVLEQRSDTLSVMISDSNGVTLFDSENSEPGQTPLQDVTITSTLYPLAVTVTLNTQPDAPDLKTSPSNISADGAPGEMSLGTQ